MKRTQLITPFITSLCLAAVASVFLVTGSAQAVQRKVFIENFTATW